VAQRPTKRLLTLGTRLYDDLCCVTQGECSVNRGLRANADPEMEFGDDASVLRDAVCVV
jgi:hypothetical protein